MERMIETITEHETWARTTAIRASVEVWDRIFNFDLSQQEKPTRAQIQDIIYKYLSEHHDTPAAPERGEWEYIETRYGAEARAGQFTIRLHWTGLTDIRDTRALIQQIVTEHNQHSTLITQRERLIDLLKQTRAFICEATWTETKPRKREAEGLVAQIDAAITPSEQEGRQPSWLYFCNKCWAVYEAVSEHSTCSRTPQRFMFYPVGTKDQLSSRRGDKR